MDPELQEVVSRFVSLRGLPAMPLEVARRVNDEEAAVMFGPLQPVETVEDRSIPGPVAPIRVRIYRPHREDPSTNVSALVYFHGGGWVVGSLDSHDGVARHLARFGGCMVISVDFRLAPEHRFPAAVDDAWAAVKWVTEHAEGIAVDPALLAVGGDSSGGTLAAVVARRARDSDIELALQLLVYPALDCDLTAADDKAAWWTRQYLRTDADALDPDASPLRAPDLSGLAPTSLLSCGLDPLQQQAEAYARRLDEAGVPVVHTCYPGLIHGAFRMPAVLPGGRRMLDDAASALRDAFGGQA